MLKLLKNVDDIFYQIEERIGSKWDKKPILFYIDTFKTKVM